MGKIISELLQIPVSNSFVKNFEVMWKILCCILIIAMHIHTECMTGSAWPLPGRYSGYTWLCAASCCCRHYSSTCYIQWLLCFYLPLPTTRIYLNLHTLWITCVTYMHFQDVQLTSSTCVSAISWNSCHSMEGMGSLVWHLPGCFKHRNVLCCQESCNSAPLLGSRRTGSTELWQLFLEKMVIMLSPLPRKRLHCSLSQFLWQTERYRFRRRAQGPSETVQTNTYSCSPGC